MLHRPPTVWRLMSTALALCFVLCSPSRVMAAVADASATLTGEAFVATPDGKFSELKCFVPGSFFVSGVATGPYPGTFTETGSLTAGEGASDFFAEFSITSLLGKVEVKGTKKFLTGDSECSTVVAEVGGKKTTTSVVKFDFTTTYTATIHTADGPVDDSGTSRVMGVFTSTFDGTSEQKTVVFNETFISHQDVGDPATLTLSPTMDTNEVGTTHTVTAKVWSVAQTPVENAVVRFEVTGSVITSGSCTTGSDGTCTFTYQGPDLPGADEIHAYVDSDRDKVEDPTEPFADAAKAWVLPVGTPGHVTGGGQTLNGLIVHGLTFGFNARSDGIDARGHCNVIDHAARIHIRCLNVTTLIQVGIHATLFGDALVDGVATRYQIDVDDVDESGRFRDSFFIKTDSGYAGGGLVTSGNVQVHRQ